MCNKHGRGRASGPIPPMITMPAGGGGGDGGGGVNSSRWPPYPHGLGWAGLYWAVLYWAVLYCIVLYIHIIMVESQWSFLELLPTYSDLGRCCLSCAATCLSSCYLTDY
jgi:hypothetical protein